MARTTTVRLLSRRRVVTVTVGAGVAVAAFASAAAAGVLPATASDAARDALARVGVTAPNAGGSATARAHRAPAARPKPFATTTSSSSTSAMTSTTSGAPRTSASTTTSTTTTTAADLPGHRGDDNASDTAKEHANENSAVHGDKPRPSDRTTSRGPDEHAADAATGAPQRKGRPTPSTSTSTTTAPSAG